MLLYLPTGGGKTSVAADVVADVAEGFLRHLGVGLTALVIAPKRELVFQLHRRLEAYGVRAGVIMGSKYKYRGDRINVASIQTLNNRDFPPADVIFIDEAHGAILEAGSGSKVKDSRFTKFFNHYKDTAIIFGLSATPRRLDNKPLGDVFEELIIPIVDGEEVDVNFLVREGWLVPARYFGAPVDSNFSASDVKQGHEKELYKSLNKKVLYEGVVENYSKYTPNEKMICFCLNVEHSKETSANFNEAGIRTWHLDGTTDEADRARILHEFEAAKSGVLCNVGILTEGYDVPDIFGIIGFRPTDSESLWLQMIGRALRPIWPDWFNPNSATAEERRKVIAESRKPFASILDHGENCSRLGTAAMRREYSLSTASKRAPSVSSVLTCRESLGGCGRIWSALEEGPICPECGLIIPSEKRERTGPESDKVEFQEIIIKELPLPAHLNKLLKDYNLAELAEFRAFKKNSMGWLEREILNRAKDNAKKEIVNNYALPVPKELIYEVEIRHFKALVETFAAIEAPYKKKYSNKWVSTVLSKFPPLRR